MDKFAIFWVATIVMAVLAFGFVAIPIVRNNRRFGLLAASAAIPLFAAVAYWFLGSPGLTNNVVPSHTPVSNIPTVSAADNTSVASVASMVDGLAERLQATPDDSKSWLLLARSYEHLDRIPEALAAYEKAVALGEYDADLAALVGSPWTAATTAAQVFGNVRLSEHSQAIVKPTDTVFVFARAVDGPPMPVAVLQRQVADLPLDFLLNDSQAMTPEFKLSSFDRVTVTARVSRSGNATEALQGLEAKSEEISVADNKHINLVID